ncbi:magnesium transporter [Robiginitomaculum antarcticum]|uniref:magnesium transporter n=1 Tax=Robiginitomaculum antarcticum TaxID=437507 RepID=UPI000370424D|nr:magnesium transporter [Robiginitomaculum antarcticum]
MTDTLIDDDHPEASAIAQLTIALDARDRVELLRLMDGAHEADVADQLEQMSSEQRRAIVDLVPEAVTPEILSELEDEVLEDVLPRLGDRQIADALSEMDSDDATAVVEELDDNRLEDVLSAMPDADRRAVEDSFTYDEETAGRVMQRDFVATPDFWTVGQVIDHMRAQGDNLPELFFNVYVVDAHMHPVGYVPISQIMRKPRNTPIANMLMPLLVKIPRDMDQEDIAYQFSKYHLISAPVVDADDRMIGMITVDDIVNVIHEENTEDMLALAGVSDAGLTDTALSTVKSRAPWLFINLLTAIMASFVISAFDYAIAEIVALAILMPIVASMGGNAGTQALAVAVRGIAERDLTRANAVRAVRREVFAAAMIGLLFAVLLAIITYIWFSNATLALVIFIAMIVNHICAGLAGILVPLGLKRAGADPAVSSSVFVTTVTDVIGFFAFLGTAALLLF